MTRFALQEERVTRIKFDSAFPSNAINLALESANLSIGDLDQIAFFEDPKSKLDRILTTSSHQNVIASLAETWDQKIHLVDLIRQRTGFLGQIYCFDHHESHAAYAFFSCDVERALVVVAERCVGRTKSSRWIRQAVGFRRRISGDS